MEYANVDFYHLIWLQMILSPVNVLLLHLNMGSEINHFHLVRNICQTNQESISGLTVFIAKYLKVNGDKRNRNVDLRLWAPVHQTAHWMRSKEGHFKSSENLGFRKS